MRLALKSSSWIIMVLGVAGVGKTTFGRLLAKRLEVRFIDLPAYVKLHKLYTGYDEHAQAYIVDFRRISIKLGQELRDVRAVVASIYPFKPRGVEVKSIIVLRLRPDKLIKVLESRGYPKWKIAENVSAELVDEPLAEALKKFDEEKVIQLDVTDKDFKVLVEKVAEALEAGTEQEISEAIDWIKVLESLGLLDEVLEYLSKYGGRENLF
ncbi:MAG: hypothetical protein DRN68_04710 [Thaumarchaeota archaeon]|nr:MAG: hypothetical protein DRN68_04710 [Nitrososphaerota archaeon]